MHITLRPNEKIYINGAVLRADRKVSLELMNDAVFLLEAHVMLERNATTPLRKLYFLVQLMLMDPAERASKMVLFQDGALTAAGVYDDGSLRTGLSVVADLVTRGRSFEALKVIRTMLPIEDACLGRTEPLTAAFETVRPAVAPVAGKPSRPAVRPAGPRRGSSAATEGAALPAA